MSILNITKGHNFVKKTVEELELSSVNSLYFYQTLRKYLKKFQFYWADTISILKFIKGYNYIKTVAEVSVHVLCTLFDEAYIVVFVPNFLKISKRVSELLS